MWRYPSNPGLIPNISICHKNVRSLLAVNRLDLIKQMLTIESCLETKLDYTIDDFKVNIKNYN